jgi:SPP1 family predicted phage head-tail adaptor
MIGSMKDRIRVDSQIKKDNGRGGWTYEYSTVGTWWGKITELSAQNIIQYRQADMNVNTEIVMRANTKISRDCILYARGNKYRVEEITEKTKGFYIIMAVGEKVAQ